MHVHVCVYECVLHKPVGRCILHVLRELVSIAPLKGLQGPAAARRGSLMGVARASRAIATAVAAASWGLPKKRSRVHHFSNFGSKLVCVQLRERLDVNLVRCVRWR